MEEKILAKSEDISLWKDLDKEMFFLLKIFAPNSAVYLDKSSFAVWSKQGNPIPDKQEERASRVTHAQIQNEWRANFLSA